MGSIDDKYKILDTKYWCKIFIFCKRNSVKDKLILLCASITFDSCAVRNRCVYDTLHVFNLLEIHPVITKFGLSRFKQMYFDKQSILLISKYDLIKMM